MTPNSAPYGTGIISSRSRRLRTIAAVLLVGIIAMAIYGARVLVPAINREAAAANGPTAYAGVSPRFGGKAEAPRLNLTPRQARALRINVIFEAAYWVVWLVLVAALMLIAWMDLREVSRSYLNQRRELWAIAAKAAADASSQGLPASESSQSRGTGFDGRSDPPTGR